MQYGGAHLMPRQYLYNDLPKHVMRNVSRFRWRAHTLVVESSVWRGGNGQSDKCYCVPVQNLVYLIFRCSVFENIHSFFSLFASLFV